MNAPVIPVLNNADVTAYNEATQIKDALARQLHSPVRWVETIQEFVRQGITHVAECGPGKVLAGLNKRIDSSVQGVALADSDSITNTIALLK